VVVVIVTATITNISYCVHTQDCDSLLCTLKNLIVKSYMNEFSLPFVGGLDAIIQVCAYE
jgi:hypothetical protein